MDTFDLVSAAVYAIDQAALFAGTTKANTALVKTTTADTDVQMLTLTPATQVGRCSMVNNYLAATPRSRRDGWVNTLQLLSLQGTDTLASQHARVTLDWVNREVALNVSYTTPPPATQKTGNIPCGNYNFGVTTASDLDRSGAMASVSFVDDKLYFAWGAAIHGEAKTTAATAGVAWALVDPLKPHRALESNLLGTTGGNHLLFPYLAVRPGGLGIMAVTLSGPDFYPTAAYATLPEDGLGQLTQVAAGVGPIDGFSGYLPPPSHINVFGPWAAGAVDHHGDFWIASEYVSQTCTLEEFLQPTDSLLQFTCGKTRTRYTNWGTHIAKIEF